MKVTNNLQVRQAPRPQGDGAGAATGRRSAASSADGYQAGGRAGGTDRTFAGHGGGGSSPDPEPQETMHSQEAIAADVVGETMEAFAGFIAGDMGADELADRFAGGIRLFGALHPRLDQRAALTAFVTALQQGSLPAAGSTREAADAEPMDAEEAALLGQLSELHDELVADAAVSEQDGSTVTQAAIAAREVHLRLTGQSSAGGCAAAYAQYIKDVLQVHPDLEGLDEAIALLFVQDLQRQVVLQGASPDPAPIGD